MSTPKNPTSGIDLARQMAPEHADAIEAMKDQLIIALVNRLGSDVDIPVEEIDATGGYVLKMQLRGTTFRFVTEHKQ